MMASMMRVLLAGSALALVVTGAAHAEDAPLRQPGRWVQDYLHRAADPDVRFGTLPNGLRYAIMHNETPHDGIAMRLRIGSGSLKERDEEQGLAHFLEHMAFRGSTNVPDGEVVHMLERQGLRFGPDTNAFTTDDETVYMFTFPKSDASALDTGLTLFREIGGRLKLGKAEVDIERGVILSEERLRDTPGYRSIKANIDNALAGTRAPQRWPIGQVETIKAATPERLRRYYVANYRPDNATIVIVGNIDVAKVEAAIRARFADWTPVGAADTLDAATPRPAHRASEFIAAGAPELLRLAWIRALDPRAETAAVDREKLAELVATTILNNRLADRAARPGAVYVGAQVQSLPSLFGIASASLIDISTAPEKWRASLDAIVEEQRQIAAGGVRKEEIARAVTQTNTALEAEVANAATRKDSDIADGLIAAAGEDQLYTSPAQDLAFAKPVLAALTADDVTAALKRVFAGAGPVLFRSAQAGAVGAATLETALASDLDAPLAVRAADSAVSWPYAAGAFGAPGSVVSRVADAALGTTTVTFANGSRLMVKPTTFEKDRVTVKALFGNGRAGADPALVHALWAAAFTPVGGTGKLSAGDIDKWAQTGGRTLGVQLRAEQRFFTLEGVTRPADFATEMQVLAAEARDPGFRPELGEKLAALQPTIAGQIEANAGAVFNRAVRGVLNGGDARFVDVPGAADIAATRPADLPPLLRPALAGPADVVVVGDIGVDAAIAAMQSTFAAGAALPPRAMVVPQIVPPAATAEPHVVMHAGRADQAWYGAYWLLPDWFSDPALARAAKVASAALESRLIDTVREKLGITYSPQTDATASVLLPGVGYLGAVLETPAANFATFRTLLDAQIADLAAHPLTADALERARAPLVAGRVKDMETNGFWATWLPLVLRDPRVRAHVLETGLGLEQVDAAAVQAVFARLAATRTPVVVEAVAKTN